MMKSQGKQGGTLEKKNERYITLAETETECEKVKANIFFDSDSKIEASPPAHFSPHQEIHKLGMIPPKLIALGMLSSPVSQIFDYTIGA
jgi:hypothetical protein